MDRSTVLSLVISAALVGWLVVLALRAGPKQARLVEDYARQRGWRYRSENPVVQSRFTRTPPFVGASRPRYRNVVRHWSDGYPGYSFDFSSAFLISDSEGRNISHYHVISVDLPVEAPTLIVRPEGGGRKIADALGIMDIQFESAAFNERWRVSSKDEQFTSQVIHPLMIEWLMETPQRHANFRIEGKSCFMVLPGRQDPARIDGVVSRLAEFAGRIPQFVWDDLSD